MSVVLRVDLTASVLAADTIAHWCTAKQWIALTVSFVQYGLSQASTITTLAIVASIAEVGSGILVAGSATGEGVVK